MLAGTIIRDVSRDLNDQEPGHEYIRWPVEQLQSYMQEALIELSSIKRSLFIHKTVVQVNPGGNWQRACDCTHITRILGESTPDGNITRTLVRMTDGDNTSWPGSIHRCASLKADMESYSINASDDREFKVFPPVLPTVTKHVLVECYIEPDGALDSDVPNRIVPAVKQWMLYRALAIDSENNQAVLSLSKSHADMYYALLQRLTEEAMQEATDGNSVRAAQNAPAS